MSPSSFSREYLSVLVYQVSQPGVVRSNWSSRSLSEKAFAADHADFADLGHFAFEHVEADAHPVARQRRDRRGDFDAVLALGQVLFLQFVLGPLEHGLVENAPFAETHLRQRLGNGLGVELAHAIEADRGNRGPFLHHDHDHVVVGLDLHVAEKARAV